MDDDNRIPQPIHNPAHKPSPFTNLHGPDARQRNPSSTRGRRIQRVNPRPNLRHPYLPQLLQQPPNLIGIHKIITRRIEQHRPNLEPMIRQSRWLARGHRLLGDILRQERRRGEIPLPVDSKARFGGWDLAAVSQGGLAWEPRGRGEGVLVVFVLGFDVEDEGEGFWV